MSRRAGIVCCALVAVALFLAAPRAGGGDDAFAQFLYDRGQKEAKSKDYDAAALTFSRALEERPHFPEAAYALGETLEKLDRAFDAMAAYRRCADEVALLTQPSPKLKSLASKASSALSRLQRRFADLDKLDRSFIDRSLALAKAKAAKSPALVQRIYETILAIDPTNSVALEGLGAHKPAAPSDPSESPTKGEGRLLIHSDDLDNWSPGSGGEWSCKDSVIAGDSRERDGKINWFEETDIEGRYRVTAQFRLTRTGGDRRAIGIFFGGDGRDNWYSLILTSSDHFALDHFENGKVVPLKDFAPDKFNPAAWHTIRIEVSPGALNVDLDGKHAFEQIEDRRDAFHGKLALFCQNCRVEFREIRLWP